MPSTLVEPNRSERRPAADVALRGPRRGARMRWATPARNPQEPGGPPPSSGMPSRRGRGEVAFWGKQGQAVHDAVRAAAGRCGSLLADGKRPSSRGEHRFGRSLERAGLPPMMRTGSIEHIGDTLHRMVRDARCSAGSAGAEKSDEIALQAAAIAGHLIVSTVLDSVRAMWAVVRQLGADAGFAPPGQQDPSSCEDGATARTRWAGDVLGRSEDMPRRDRASACRCARNDSRAFRPLERSVA